MPRHADEMLLDGSCHCGTLRKATRRISQLYDEVLEPSGLKLSQFQLLSQIERAALPPTIKELAAALVLDPSALGHNMRPLERDGYIKQIRNEADGRSRRATLTPLGRKKFSECRKLWRQAQKKFECAYGAERARSLAKVLSELFSEKFTDVFVSSNP